MLKVLNIIKYLKAVFGLKCPRCRQGFLFISKNPYQLKNITKMYEKCQVCNQKTEIEPGFYYGTGYVSYGLSVGFLIIYCLIWKIFTDFKFLPNDKYIFKCLFSSIFILIILQPIFMRLSRIFWLSWFVKYEFKEINEK